MRSRSTVCSVSMRELLLVIGRAADVGMDPTRRRGRIVGLERHAIEAVLEHRLDVAIRPGADGDRPTAGGLDAFGAVLLREPQQAETGPIALLRDAAGSRESARRAPRCAAPPWRPSGSSAMGLHSRCARWAWGMCSGIVVKPPT